MRVRRFGQSNWLLLLAIGLLATVAVVILGARLGKRALANSDA